MIFLFLVPVTMDAEQYLREISKWDKSMSNESISFHLSQKSNNLLLFWSGDEVTTDSGLSLDCTTSSMTKFAPRWLHPSLPCFLAPKMSPPPPRETGSPRGAVTSEKVFQVCQHLVHSKVSKFSLLCTMPLCWRSVIGWFWQNTQSSSSSEPYKTMLNPPRPLTIGAI